VAIVTRGSVKTGYSLWAAYETDGILDSGIPIVATIQMPAVPGDPPNLTFSSTPDERYGVQYTDSLDFVDWLPLVEIVATGFQTTIPLPTVGVPETGRFYRVVQLQHP
jgi:hypothetical protein